MHRVLVFLLALTAIPLMASAQETIRIGAALPLSGSLQLEGQKLKRGYDLWAALVNEAGGINIGGKRLPVEILYRDYGSDFANARLAVEALAQNDKVRLLFAPYGSKSAREASPVAERYRIPMIAAAASSSQAFGRGHDYFFGTLTPNATLIEPFMDLVRRARPGISSVGVIVRDDLFPKSLAREVAMTSARHGLKIIRSDLYIPSNHDHRKELVGFVDDHPDWIFAFGYTHDLLALRHQMRELSVAAPLVTMIAAPAYQEFLDAAGPLSENITSAAWWHPTVRYRGAGIFGSTERFVQLFKLRYQTVPDYIEASAALSGELFQIALENAGSLIGSRVQRELAGMDVVTFWGPVRFGPNGQNQATPPLIFQIQEGEPVILHPEDVRSGDLRFGVQ